MKSILALLLLAPLTAFAASAVVIVPDFVAVHADGTPIPADAILTVRVFGSISGQNKTLQGTAPQAKGTTRIRVLDSDDLTSTFCFVATVWEDVNKNGAVDEGEEGAPGPQVCGKYMSDPPKSPPAAPKRPTFESPAKS